MALERLAEETSRMGGWAYVLTVSDDGRPHVVAAVLSWSGTGELVATVGHRSLDNVSRCPGVTLLWPPAQPGGHSLIVDGSARLERGDRRDGLVIVQPTRAVYHRPAPTDDGDPSCRPGPADAGGCGPVLEA